MSRGLSLLVVFVCKGLLATEPPPDPRGQVVFQRECVGQDLRTDVTLFANGTVRLRDGEGSERQMQLAELGAEELAALLRRLEAEDLSEVDPNPPVSELEWTEWCELELQLDDQPGHTFRYGRFDSLPLGLSRVVAIADELVAEVAARAPVGHLPRKYVPRRGDILERADGALFKVIGYTSDRRGVELQGVEVPLTIYIGPGELNGQFIRLVKRDNPP